jgi:predicted MFS family arabinose efflux permease
MLFGVSGMLPIALGAIAGDAILARAGYAVLFQVALGFAALALALALPLPEMAATAAAREVEKPRGFRRVLVQPDLIPLWGIGTVFSLALAAMFTFLKTFVMTTGIGSVGGFFSAYAGAALALRIFLGWVPDRVGAKRVLFPALIALAVGFFALALAHDDRDVLLAGVLCGAGHGYTFPLLFTMVVNRARDADRGTAMSIYTALFDLGVLLGGPFLGGLIDRFGYTTMFITDATLILAGTAAFALVDRGRR